MDAFRIAFEHVGDTDGTDFAFEYSILAKKAGDSDYTKVTDHAKANRTDNYAQVYKFNAAQYSEVKIVMHSCETQGGTQNGWPAHPAHRRHRAPDRRSRSWGSRCCADVR